jgi:hypothetical protein
MSIEVVVAVKHRGPVITLLVGIVIAAVMVVLSVHAKASPTYPTSKGDRPATAVVAR